MQPMGCKGCEVGNGGGGDLCPAGHAADVVQHGRCFSQGSLLHLRPAMTSKPAVCTLSQQAMANRAHGSGWAIGPTQCASTLLSTQGTAYTLAMVGSHPSLPKIGMR